MWTFEFYAQLIEGLSQKGFCFQHFGVKKGKSAYLRHDIDVNIDLALELAEFECRLNVVSTYFVMLEAEAYNTFSKKSVEQLKKIIELGHDIGLHYFMYDSERIEEQSKLLSKLLGHPIKSFSVHKPASLSLDVTALKVPGLINAYEKAYFSKEGYMSDSNHHFRIEDPLAFINAYEGDTFQLLTHPLWWAEKKLSIESKRFRIEKLHSELLAEYLNSNIKVFQL